MRHFFLFIFLLLIYNNLLVAQSGRSIRVSAGEDIAQTFSPRGFYRFSQFSKASLFFKAGGRNSISLTNYNMLSGMMQFISTAGDTLDIANPAGIDSVVFENSTFYYKDCFMEAVAAVDSIRLLKKPIIKMQVEKVGAYGQPSPASSIDNIRSILIGTGVYKFTSNQDVVVTEYIYWYWMDVNNNMVKATKGNLLNLLPPDKQSAAETYMKQHKPNFENETDLKRLILTIEGEGYK